MKRFIMVIGTFFLLGIAMTGVVFGAPARGDSGGGGAAPAKAARSGSALDTPTATPTCPANWSMVTSPTLQLEDAELFGVDAASPSDVWAVGVYFTQTHGTQPEGTKPGSNRPGRQQLVAPH